MNRNWHPIDQYSDAALRRMARDSRDMRSNSATRELERRREASK
jgi:hypothetical protein